jgi:hypothetical protein
MTWRLAKMQPPMRRSAAQKSPTPTIKRKIGATWHPSILDIQSLSAGQGEHGIDRHRPILWAVSRTANARSSLSPTLATAINHMVEIVRDA